MKNKVGKKIISFLLIFSFLISLGFTVFASQADNLRQELDDISQKQQEYKDKIEESKQDIKEKENEKENLDNYLNATKDKIDVYDEMIDKLDDELDALEEDLASAEDELESQIEVYKKRIRSSYMDGEVSFLEVLFDSGTVSEFLVRLDSQRRIAENDKKIIENMEEVKKKISASVSSVQTKKNQQTSLKANLQSEKKNYEKELKQAENAISRLENDVAAYTKKLEKIEQDEERIRNEIKNLSNSNSAYVGGEFAWPLPGYTRISSPYGMRVHPVVGGNRFHNGIDLPAPKGTKIVAANSGKIIKKQYSSSWGNYVVIDHGGGKTTLYAHASAFAKISVGDTVERGQTIAYVGTTGWSTGNHLHFSIMVNGDYVNPTTYY
ncbi:MAG: peptidoglycan DD-metalloendopeptidase family protein [Clostridia bacterium]|nr:peptidoglycan DD-metalloendopeptidase family protein [Clostridia bacterium]